METTPFGTTDAGQTVRLFTLRNHHGLQVRVCEYGALVTSVITPDHEGQTAEITLGKPDFASWLDNPDYLGATVGRFGNRIAHGRFTLDGVEYQLPTNPEPGGIPCHLHGGPVGFNRRLWKGEPVIRPGAEGVCFSLFSDASDQGYPGALSAKVCYWLTDDDELVFEATATTDAPTPVNLINHIYWNLSGDPSRTILDHQLEIQADSYLPTNSGLIPTGKMTPVAGTPLDFTSPTVIGERIDDDFPALKHGHGYDHCWVLRESDGDLRPAANLRDLGSGRVLDIRTNQPGLQFYTGNFLAEKHTGLCLETQAFPDSPNQPNFPSSILRPGQTYRHLTRFRFSTIAPLS